MPVDIHKQIADLERELIMRRNVYKKRVTAGVMKPRLAEDQIDATESCIRTLKDVRDWCEATGISTAGENRPVVSLVRHYRPETYGEVEEIP